MAEKLDVDLIKLKALYDQGKNDSEIAKILGNGLSRQGVTYRRRLLNLPTKYVPDDILFDYRDEIIRMHEQRVPLARQVRILGVNERRLQRARRRLGLSGEPQVVISEERSRQVEQMLKDGMPYVEVHRTTGISQRWIREHFPGMGWTNAQSAAHRSAIGEARKAGLSI